VKIGDKDFMAAAKGFIEDGHRRVALRIERSRRIN
jgi:hypothetical protein